MKRLFDNLVIDLFAAALMIGMAATGYVLRFPLPPGSNKSLSLWGLTRHQWGDVHFWIGFVLLGVIVLHIVLHWQWLVISVRRKLTNAKAAPAQNWFWGVTTIVFLGAAMTLFGWAAHHGVEEVIEQREGICPPSSSEGQKEKRAVDASPLPYSTDGGKHLVTFWKDVYPVLERSCLSCHGPNKQRGSFRVDQREDFFGKGGNPPLVVPGKSEDSPLIAIVSGKKDIARPDVHQLADGQVEILRAWIDAGAAWPERPSSPD